MRSMRLALLSCVVVTLVACSDAPAPQPPRQPATTLTFASPAARYNDPTEPAPSSPLGDHILAAIRDAATRAGRSVPVADERLFMASAALATVVPEEGTLSHPVVDFSLEANGVIEPSPELLVVWGNLTASGDELAKLLQPNIAEIVATSDISSVGIGGVVRGRGGYGALVLMLLPSQVHTSPIPRALAADGVADFELTLGPHLRHPIVLVTRQRGDVDEVATKATDHDALSAHLECGGTAGKLVVEIVAHSGEGGASLAKFPIWCGEEPVRSIPITRPVNDVPARPTEAEQTIFARVNAERAKLGRPPLQWDEGLAKIAREHSQDMLRTHVVGTRIPHTPSIALRVLATRNDLEVTGGVARTYGVAEADEGLLDLPSTRRRLIAEEATKLGIGIVYGAQVGAMRELYITQIVGEPATGMAAH